MEHTQWTAAGGEVFNGAGDKVATVSRGYENVIVRAVNCHAELLEALQIVLKTMYANPNENVDMITRCSTTVKQALSKAEGK